MGDMVCSLEAKGGAAMGAPAPEADGGKGMLAPARGASATVTFE